jgi:hypothetical protein
MQFTKPAQFNGTQLKEELATVGIEIPFVTDTADGFIHFDVQKSKESAAVEIVANHVPVDKSAQNATARQAILDKLGLTAQEATILLS